MANVLSNLFSDIAKAIRAKTGDTSKMSPMDFPSKIQAIESGGGATKTMVSKTGTFIATSDTKNVVTHNLGVAPDLIYVKNETSMSGALVVIGKSTALANACKGLTQGAIYQHETDTSSLYPIHADGVTYCIDTTQTNLPISEADETTFKFGGAMVKAVVGDTYYYEVVGGIV